MNQIDGGKDCTLTWGVGHIGESWQSRFIDFRECNHNWIQYGRRTEHLKGDEIQEVIRKDKTIGQSGSDANSPYFEFFPRPLRELNLIQKTHLNSSEKLLQQLDGVQSI